MMRWMLLAAAALLTLPAMVSLPRTGIDPSWELGLHLARDRGLLVGRDIVFNYGPWGFLNVPLTLTRSLWLAAVGYALVVQLALYAALGVWMARRLSGWQSLAAVLPLVVFLPAPEYRLLLALLLWTHLCLDSGKERPWAAGALGVAAAATLMVKFSMGLAAAAIVAGGLVAALFVGRRQSGVALAGGFVGGTFFWGWLALGSPAAVVRFLDASMEISVGYGTALERGGPAWQPIVALTTLTLLAAGLLRERCAPPTGWPTLLLPALGLLGLTFKHAFVRHETHAFLAFSVGSIVLCWIALGLAHSGDRASRLLRAGAAAALFACGLVVVPPLHLPRLPADLGRNVGSALQATREMSAPGHRAALRRELQGHLPLDPRALELIGGRSVDILTVEVALAEAWGLNWRPRPVLQSYAVATSKLDEMDAAFFAGPAAPERLLVDLQGIDTRHPFMDGPRTWREILSRYRPLGRDERWMVLGRLEHPREVREKPLSRIQLPLNRLSPVPQPARGHLEMRVRLEPTWVGRLVSLPWKLPEVRLGLAAQDDPPPARRILAATADGSFPLTRRWIDSSADLWELYADPDRPAPVGLAFVTGGAWAWRDVVVEFYQVEYGDAGGPLSGGSGGDPMPGVAVRTGNLTSRVGRGHLD